MKVIPQKKYKESYFDTIKDIVALIVGAFWVVLFCSIFSYISYYSTDIRNLWFNKNPFLIFIILPITLAVLVYIIQKYIPLVAGSGIPQVISTLREGNYHKAQYLLSFKSTILKIPLVFIAMVAGASVGFGGPSVQVGAATFLGFGLWCQRYHLAFNTFKANHFIIIGAGSGLAAAFQAPFTGLIFVIEELGRTKIFKLEPKIVFGIIATGLLLQIIFGYSNFFDHYTGNETVQNMILWVVISALVCGVLGAMSAKLMSQLFMPSFLKDYFKQNSVVFAFVIGLILATIGIISEGRSLGTGYGSVIEHLHQSQGEQEFKFTSILRIIATIFSYLSSIAGGIFGPALTAGSDIGHDLWLLTGQIIDERLLSLLCMASFLGALTGSPITAAVIVLEMTGSQAVFIYLLFASFLSAQISKVVNPKPFYYLALKRYQDQFRELHKKNL